MAPLFSIFHAWKAVLPGNVDNTERVLSIPSGATTKWADSQVLP